MSSIVGTRVAILLVSTVVGLSASSRAQIINASTPHETRLTTPTLNIPPHLSQRLSPQQQELIKKATPQQLEILQTVVRPEIVKRLQVATAQRQGGIVKSWREIIRGGSGLATTNGIATGSAALLNRSVSSSAFNFTNGSGSLLTPKPAVREFQGTLPTNAAGQKLIFGAPGTLPRTSIMSLSGVDLDQDGLPDDFENQVSDNFTPIYSISGGEFDQFATFGDYVPMTVTSLVGTNPPVSYFRVQPLGIATDPTGAQVYALRIDYLSLWNADGGLIGGGGVCAYSYFGFDGFIQALSGHDLDAERSAMLVAAPLVNGGYNPDPNAYNLYTVYMGAHEGTIVDQSAYADFSPAIPAGNHLHLSQSLSKHSTYNFNPDYLPLIPGWAIASAQATIDILYAEGVYDEGAYLFYEALLADTVYGCVVERFSDQGGQFASPRINVGEPAIPINGSTFIQDNSSRALHLTDKLTSPVF